MAKKRVFQEKPPKVKTAKVVHHKFKNKVNNQRDIFDKKSSNDANDFFVKSSDKANIRVELSKSIKPSKHSVNDEENQFKVRKSDVIKSKVGKQKQVTEENDDVKNSKKPFDKKLFRLKKYSKKYKLQQWEEKRKKSLLREYHKSLKDEDSSKIDVAKIYEEDDLESNNANEGKDMEDSINDNSECQTEEKTTKKKIFLKPHERFQKIKEEKQKKREEWMQRQAEREKAIQEAKKERYERNKKLSRKTKKGQPIMRYRMEMLLEKIEKSLKN